MISTERMERQAPAPRPTGAETASVLRGVEKPRAHQGELIAMLGEIQAQHGYLPEAALRRVASKTGLPLMDVYGVATFYSAFSFEPRGEHTIMVCLGTACHVRGGARLADTLASELKIEAGETTADRRFSLETVNCLGCCAIGPLMLIDGVYHGEMTPREALEALKKTGTTVRHEKAKVSCGAHHATCKDKRKTK